MKIINDTDYISQDLRRFFHTCFQMSPHTVNSKKLHVKVAHSKGRVLRGIAYLGRGFRETGGIGYYIEIGVPKDSLEDKDSKQKRTLAWVFIHELMHCTGLNHNEMIGSYFHNHRKRPWNDPDLTKLRWADNLQIRVRPKKSEERPMEKCERLLDRAKKMLERHQTRYDREAHLVNKWRKKVRYCEKRLDRLGGTVKHEHSD